MSDNEELFDVVFFGILQTGRDRDTVLQNMATLFKTEPTKLAPYFAGGRKVIKGKLDAETAEKYRQILENVGLVIRIEACENPPPENRPSDDTGASPTAVARNTTQASPSPQPRQQTAASTQPAGQQITGDGEMPGGTEKGRITIAPVGANIIENPVITPPQKIGDISHLSMAEPGADVIENPVPVVAQEIGDISKLSMAEVGADILASPASTVKTVIPDIGNLAISKDYES